MAFMLTCPSCNATLRLANPVPAGKGVRCPKCREVFQAPVEEQEPAGVETTDEEEPEPAPKPPPPKQAVTRPKPVRSPREAPPEEMDEVEDRDEEEEPAPRPAKRIKKRKASDPAVTWGMVGGLIGLGIAVILFALAKATATGGEKGEGGKKSEARSGITSMRVAAGPHVAPGSFI
jgi:predicted Zn finger-like uncharacterized protein